MAKKTSIKVRLVPESKPDSPFYYYVKKPSSGEKAKIKLKVKNIVFYHGDGLKGWPVNFLFDRIIITALAKEMPKYLIDQLSDGGVMVLPLVYKSEQFITRVTKIKNNVKIKKYWRVKFVPLLPGIK